MNRIRSVRRLNKLESRARKKEIVEYNQRGEGRYVFRNRFNADLTLPKPDANGKKVVGPKQEFEGDSYFMKMVQNNEATLVRTIEEPRKKIMTNEDKLIVDQPDQVTCQGTVEHVVTPKDRPLNEGQPADIEKSEEEVLLNEDPMDGVEIVVNE